MDVLDFIHDKFSQDCAIGTVLHLLMAHYDLSAEEAQNKIDEYFEIVEAMDDQKKTIEQELTAKKVIMRPFVKAYLKKQQAQYVEDLKKAVFEQPADIGRMKRSGKI